MDNYLKLDKYLNREIMELFKHALKFIIKDPSLGPFFIRTLASQKKAARKRLDWEKKGVHSPPFMIFSITDRCNLACKGCYSQAFKRESKKELDAAELEMVIQQAYELGTSIILIAGGEPLVRKEITEIIAGYPDIIFPVFTNGLLIDDELISGVAARKNFIPVLSLDGNEPETDGRRGAGVYVRVLEGIEKIRGKNIFWGISITINRHNFDQVTDYSFVSGLINQGCKLFFYISYIPVKPGTEDMCLAEEQEMQISQKINQFKKKLPALFIVFPGGEEEMGGCLASGKGFVHVSPEGNLEPCPFAPYSDTNLKEVPLKTALNSVFLRKIRENHENLRETRGGCALWENREWVKSLLKEN